MLMRSRLSAWRERRAIARLSDGTTDASGYRVPERAVDLLCGARLCGIFHRAIWSDTRREMDRHKEMPACGHCGPSGRAAIHGCAVQSCHHVVGSDRPHLLGHAGAAAGAAAVLASMPADCVKTVLEMETSGAARGPLGDAWHFMATARGMLQRGGPGALFIGMGPRLAETVRALAAAMPQIGVHEVWLDDP